MTGDPYSRHTFVEASVCLFGPQFPCEKRKPVICPDLVSRVAAVATSCLKARFSHSPWTGDICDTLFVDSPIPTHLMLMKVFCRTSGECRS
jgi:hypothetical protein